MSLFCYQDQHSAQNKHEIELSNSEGKSWLTSKADFVPAEMVSLDGPGPGGGRGSGGPRLNVGRCAGLVSFSRTLFMSLTVSPSEKYSSSTSLAVLTRSRLAPVILTTERTVRAGWEILPSVSPDTFVSDVDRVLILRQRNCLSVSDQSVPPGVSLQRPQTVVGAAHQVVPGDGGLVPPDGLFYQ